MLHVAVTASHCLSAEVLVNCL